jgi:hypothetical protein
MKATSAPRNRGGGRNSCRACAHPDREALNALLMAAAVPLSKLSKKYGISVSSLSKHRSGHISRNAFATVKRARAGASKASPASVRQRIEDGLVALDELMAGLENSGETAQWLNAYRESVRTLELIGKISGEFSDSPVVQVDIWQSPDWGRLRAVIFSVLEKYPELRALLAKRLLALEGGTE